MLPDAVADQPKPEKSTCKRMSCSLIAAVFGTVILLSIFFYKSVFLGLPIARLGLLPKIDAMFDPGLKEAILSFKDPSGYLIFFPNGFFAESMWRVFVPPLWNPFTGCGYPLFADPQSFIHSPAHLLSLFSSPEAYNLGLLFEIALGAIGMLLLARFYGLGYFSAVFAALAFALSPRILVQLDIGGNEGYFPWIFLGFAWLAQKPSAAKAALVGVLCALVAFAAHPETVFFAVLFAAALAFFSMSISGFQKDDEFKALLLHLLKNVGRAITCLFITAFVSILVASPLIFPFLEYLQNAYLYKEDAGVVFRSSWIQFFGELYFNQGLEPLFIGAPAAVFAPLGFFYRRSLSIPVFITLFLLTSICMPSEFIYQIISRKPFSYLSAQYVQPEIVLLLALLAGMGLDCLLQKKKTWYFGPALFLSGLFAAYYPWLHLSQASGTADFSSLWKSGRNLLSYTSLLALPAFLVSALAFLDKPVFKILASSLLLSLNFASLALAGRNALPVNPKFTLDPPEAVAFMGASKERCIATGSNFFLPNANCDFFVYDLRCFSPLLPLRYHKFIEACGARPYNLYFYDFPNNCSPLLDLASVKYLASRQAIRAQNEPAERGIVLNARLGRLLPGLRILESKLSFDPENSQIDADMTLRVHDNCKYRYSLEFLLFDSHGRQTWASRQQVLNPAEEKQHLHRIKESFPVFRSSSFPLSFCLRIKDTWISQTVLPEPPMDSVSGAYLLAKVEKAVTTESGHDFERHYKLVKEFPANGCRVYENLKALPQAFIVRDAKHFRAADSDSVLKQLSSFGFAPDTEVLIEDLSQDAAEKNVEARGGADNQEQEKRREPGQETVKYKNVDSFLRKDCNRIEINCKADADSYLVLTDAYYPGWICFVDGKEKPVYPANYLFRAVRLEKGKHRVSFVFSPETYNKSLLLSLITLLLVFVLSCRKRHELFALDLAVRSSDVGGQA